MSEPGLAPFEHPFLSGLLGDAEVSALLGIDAEIAAMVRFETALAQAQAAEGVISQAAADAIGRAGRAYIPDFEALRTGTARDGVVTPELVRQLRAIVDAEHRDRLHLGATSQDVIDTALMLRIKPVCTVLDSRLEALTGELDRLVDRFGTNTIMARTRMQDALPITAADRLSAWRAPLVRHRERAREITPRLLKVQLGGAVGTRSNLDGKGEAIAVRMGDILGLGSGLSWQSQRDSVVEWASWLALVSGSLGKMGQDVALMALAGGQILLSGGGGSSAMAHKSNPVAAEVLVSLARHNAALSSGMNQAMVHENERSGAAWTLEWLTLPNMIMATGAGLLLAERLLAQIEFIGERDNARPTA
jgi:3-carboxy-cis,cis-muconate cycloisomerase